MRSLFTFVLFCCCLAIAVGDAPTDTAISITFGTTVKLQNVTSSSWGTSSKNVVIDSLADTLNIDSTHISFLSEKSIQWSSGLYELDALFKIKYSTDYLDLTFSNSSELYDYAANVLIESASNHDFVRTVKYYAHLSNEDNLEEISRASFVNSESVDENSSDDDFSTQDTFGVVVVGVLLVTVVGAFCFFYVFCVWCYPKSMLESVSGKGRSSNSATYSDIESNVKQSETVDVGDVVAVVPATDAESSISPQRSSSLSFSSPFKQQSASQKTGLEEIGVGEQQVSKDVVLGEINEYYPN